MQNYAHLSFFSKLLKVSYYYGDQIKDGDIYGHVARIGEMSELLNLYSSPDTYGERIEKDQMGRLSTRNSGDEKYINKFDQTTNLKG
jgi:hypothetical protein